MRAGTAGARESNVQQPRAARQPSAEAVAAGLPDARLTLLAGQRHGCLQRAPQLFADTVLDFLGH